MKRKRLTKTFKNGELHTLRPCCVPYYTKLSQLEDIEDELGIDLITLFKLINVEDVYSYGHTNITKNTGQVNIYNKTITIWNGSCHQVYPLSEYGKSFTLTKGELKLL